MASISFPFGLKREAEIYCTSSKVGLSTEPNAPLAINRWADYFTQADICEASMQEVLDSVATVTRNAVEHMKDDSEDNVAWIMALVVSGIIKAKKPDCPLSYDEIFKYGFTDYYEKYNY